MILLPQAIRQPRASLPPWTNGLDLPSPQRSQCTRTFMPSTNYSTSSLTMCSEVSLPTRRRFRHRAISPAATAQAGTVPRATLWPQRPRNLANPERRVAGLSTERAFARTTSRAWLAFDAESAALRTLKFWGDVSAISRRALPRHARSLEQRIRPGRKVDRSQRQAGDPRRVRSRVAASHQA